MTQELTKKYGLFTAIAMVVGIVIGSGIFFKAEVIMNETGGNLNLGTLSWIIGGMIMISCAYAFACLATKISKANGIVDYSEEMCGEKYAYMVGWFLTSIYYPTLTSVLTWVSARYTFVLFGHSDKVTGGGCLLLSALYLVICFCINTLSPVIAGKIQISTTIIKLVPLFIMGLVGTAFGLSNGVLEQNFTTVVSHVPADQALFKAVCATAFAYEGWIIATTINSEIKDSKKNLPRALIIGTAIIAFIYVTYYIGLAGSISSSDMMSNGQEGVKTAFQNIFKGFGGSGLFVFVVISCIGTTNGLMMGCCRGIYSLAVRHSGPSPEKFKQLDPYTNVPLNSAVLGLLLTMLWLGYFYVSNLSKGSSDAIGIFAFDSSELPIITTYLFYIPIFFMMIKKRFVSGIFKRVLVPVCAIAGSLFMMIAAYTAHKKEILGYLIIFAGIMLIGMLFDRSDYKTKKKH